MRIVNRYDGKEVEVGETFLDPFGPPTIIRGKCLIPHHSTCRLIGAEEQQ